MFFVIVDRILRGRRNELVLTFVLFLTAVASLMWSQALGATGFAATFGEKVSFALLVSIIVRWVTVWFTETEGVERSSHVEVLEAIAAARTRVWISQTWLPGTEADATRILRSKADSIRLLLASHKPGSPITARIRGRGIEPAEAKAFASRSAAPLVATPDSRVSIRFCYDHHPGWIAVVDSFVFWGPTPLDTDNWANDFLFHRHRSGSEQGRFWEKQFEKLWSDKHSHNYETEKAEFNTTLR